MKKVVNTQKLDFYKNCYMLNSGLILIGNYIDFFRSTMFQKCIKSEPKVVQQIVLLDTKSRPKHQISCYDVFFDFGDLPLHV